MIELGEHQCKAIDKLRSGSILCGGVGSGKSRTALGYYFIKECGGSLRINGVGETGPMSNPKDLYIITTARKRDAFEWEQECLPFLLSKDRSISICGVKVTIDSWNNIMKYKNATEAFFIFDEQRVSGSGAWVKHFLRIAKSNNWIVLSATPGDTWMDYVPIFIANGFYKNRTDFIDKHVIYKSFSRYPQIDKYIAVSRLIRLRDQIIVHMRFEKKTVAHDIVLDSNFNRDVFRTASVERWHPYEHRPIRDVSELCYVLRKISNSDPSRAEIIKNLLLNKHQRIIIFYNFDYELHILTAMGSELNIEVAQWNGHKHENVPKTDRWIYLVQYFAGSEAWNCIETNAIVFYSQSYSYKTMVQAAGRIDRLNTPFIDLYYYHLRSKSAIDVAIQKALDCKQNFNDSMFLNN